MELGLVGAVVELESLKGEGEAVDAVVVSAAGHVCRLQICVVECRIGRSRRVEELLEGRLCL